MSSDQEVKDIPEEKWIGNINMNFRRRTHRANKCKKRYLCSHQGKQIKTIYHFIPM